MFHWTARLGRALVLAVVTAALLAAVAAPGFAGPQGAVAPLAPEYLRWLVSLPPTVLHPSQGGFGLGLRPSPQDALYTRPAKRARTASLEAAAASYDLRTANRVSSVKDQGNFGTCWAFASCGSLESALLPGESWDFSEDNMVLQSGFFSGGGLYDAGGNIWMAAAYLTRWGGPVTQAQDAYGDGRTPDGLSPVKHVQEIVMIPKRASATDNTAIKDAIVQYGAAYVSMGWYGASSGSEYYSAANGAYYYNGTDSTNHGVLLVGWDDAYPAAKFATKPPGDGAFLVKNSWGVTWGLSGYFWVSYHDTDFGRIREMAVFNGSQPTTNYTGVYQYDPLGDCQSWGFSSTTGWFANVFTAQSSAAVGAVGFYAQAPGTSYEVYTGTSLATKTLKTSGTFATMGYHTVSLPSPVSITGGEKFVVAVKATTPGVSYPIAFEAPYTGYSDGARANAGESYVSSDGSTWTDMTTNVANANVCLKAYTTSSTPPPAGSPTISSFSPTSGLVGAAVTITGTNFTGATAVKFNGTGAAFSVVGPTQITTTVPTGATSGSIAITNAAGTGTSSSSFTVTTPPPPANVPVITSFSPASGGYRTMVSIYGKAFTGATKVTFNGLSAPFYISSDTQVRASAPIGVSTGPIAVTTPDGTAVSATNFTVGAVTPPAAPTISSIAPTSGPVGTAVAVTGTNLTGASSVKFNGVAASFSVVSATKINATVPAAATTGVVTVTTGGGTATGPTFTVTIPAPTTTSLDPATGPVGTPVTINGTNLTGVTAVTFGGVGATFTPVSATQVTATVPAGLSAGAAAVAVTTPGGTASTLSFTVTDLPPVPTITSFTPGSGVVGAAVTITGTNFTGATAVAFNGTGSTFSVVNSTQITTTVPAGATSGSITVTTPGGTATSASSFTVIVPLPGAPYITSFSPLSGARRTYITITGGNFTGATQVTIGGVSVPYLLSSATKIRAYVALTAKTGLITVTTPLGTATSVSTFYVL